MKYQATLAKTTTDKIRSKILSPFLVELTLEVYMPAHDYADFITTYFENEFQVDLPDAKELQSKED